MSAVAIDIVEQSSAENVVGGGIVTLAYFPLGEIIGGDLGDIHIEGYGIAVEVEHAPEGFAAARTEAEVACGYGGCARLCFVEHYVARQPEISRGKGGFGIFKGSLNVAYGCIGAI